MKKLILILFIFISLNSFAQLRVKEGSFKKVENCVILDKRYDDNNKPMALIRIYTENIQPEQKRDFWFYSDFGTNLEPSIAESGEIELYATYTVKKIKLQHNFFSPLDIVIPFDLEGHCCYELVLQVPGQQPTPEQPIKKEFTYLIVSADQDNAVIYIDGEEVGVKESQKRLEVGTTHSWRIECELYHSESGTVTLKDKTDINRNLRPNFGYLNITTAPEQDAKVFVDGNYIGTSPIKTDKLKSGTHTVKVIRDMYKTTEQTFTVTDGQTTNANVTMPANFVTLTVDTDNDSDIYIDEEYKGKGKWTGRLSDGSHLVEARKSNHRSTQKNIDLVLGVTESISLEAPRPINGSIDITTSPIRAQIYIDGKNYGETPNYINEIIIGTHELRLEKQGCTTITKTITIKEGEILNINEKLQTGKEIAIKTDKSGDRIYVDGNYVGISPITSSLSFGSHEIKAERDGKTVSKNIKVSQSVSSGEYVLTFKQEINGHEYVDLGLPSGLKWATCNVGATSPEDYGDYFAWGETTTKSGYSISGSLTHGLSISQLQSQGYIDGEGNLTSSHDAATANWGGSWRMPTKAEIQELLDECTWQWTTQGGKNGYKVTGPNGNSIFLPAAGYRLGSSLYSAGEDGNFWSSTPDESGTDSAYYLGFGSGYHDVYWFYRYYGQSVRPVAE